jgi:hypothetical protein
MFFWLNLLSDNEREDLSSKFLKKAIKSDAQAQILGVFYFRFEDF